MGKIPSTDNMISSIIISPKPGQKLHENEDFTISVPLVPLLHKARHEAASLSLRNRERSAGTRTRRKRLVVTPTILELIKTPII